MRYVCAHTTHHFLEFCHGLGLVDRARTTSALRGVVGAVRSGLLNDCGLYLLTMQRTVGGHSVRGR